MIAFTLVRALVTCFIVSKGRNKKFLTPQPTPLSPLPQKQILDVPIACSILSLNSRILYSSHYLRSFFCHGPTYTCLGVWMNIDHDYSQFHYSSNNMHPLSSRIVFTWMMMVNILGLINDCCCCCCVIICGGLIN